MLSIGFTLAGALAVQSVGISLWQHVAATRFRFQRGEPELPSGFAFPSITLLKPLKGCDPETRKNLESWFTQDYPGELQILFGVASAKDPAFATVENLLRKYPHRKAELLVCPPCDACNPKVSTLIQLNKHARGNLIVISDADVRAPRPLLRHLTATLSQPGVGLAHCLYQMANPTELAMRMEAMGVNGDFWAQVTQARSLGMIDFALGAVMALRREVLEEIGGFQRIADYLADDYKLGSLVSSTGRRIELCRIVVDCFSPSEGSNEVWRHQLRWTRTIRICKPGPFLLSILGNATLWPLCFLAASVFSSVGCAAFAVWLSIRILLLQSRARRLSGDSSRPTDAWLAPAHDLLQVVLWAAAQFGNRVTWHGKTYGVLAGGKMVPIESSEQGMQQAPAR